MIYDKIQNEIIQKKCNWEKIQVQENVAINVHLNDIDKAQTMPQV